jgi:pimeloyl-ACP methyl ester carboxylesterase
MQRFVSFDGVEIAYHEFGKRDDSVPVVLHHAFAADAHHNWVVPGVVDALVDHGRWVVGIDARGHGNSDKPHDAKRYGEGSMARDVSALFDLVGSPQYDLVGYSMGAAVAAITATRDFRIRRLVLGGVGGGLAERGGIDREGGRMELLANVLLTEDQAEIAASPVGRFRQLADAVGADREALAAITRSRNTGRIMFGQIAAETLVLVGRDDALAARPELLAAAIPGARYSVVGGDHLSAVNDPGFTSTLVDFIGLAPMSIQ